MAFCTFFTARPAVLCLLTFLFTESIFKVIQLLKSLLWKPEVHHRSNKSSVVLLCPKLHLLLNRHVRVITLHVSVAASCPVLTAMIWLGVQRVVPQFDLSVVPRLRMRGAVALLRPYAMLC